MDCIDLRPWAKKNHYRWRYEASYLAETLENRGDGRWYVEVLCQNGAIYPYGSDLLCAYVNSRVRSKLKGVGSHHQWDGGAEVIKFAPILLSKVASVLKPRKRRSVGASLEQLARMRERKKSLG